MLGVIYVVNVGQVSSRTFVKLWNTVHKSIEPPNRDYLYVLANWKHRFDIIIIMPEDMDCPTSRPLSQCPRGSSFGGNKCKSRDVIRFHKSAYLPHHFYNYSRSFECKCRTMTREPSVFGSLLDPKRIMVIKERHVKQTKVNHSVSNGIHRR